MSQSVESFSQEPIVSAPQAYLYNEYSDDADLQGILQVANQFVQGYLDWFTNTPLAVWTNSNIAGSLLDWIGNGIYGILRPAVTTSQSRISGAFNSRKYNAQSYNGLVRSQSGSVQVCNDDFYKRTLTWFQYRGDTNQMSIFWMKRRIARFLYGSNGTDIDIGLCENISITPTMMRPISGYNTMAYNTFAYNSMTMVRSGMVHLKIVLPNIGAAQTFKSLFDQGVLIAPIQVTYNIVIQ